MKLETLLPYALWLAAGVLSLVISKKSQIDAWAEKNPRLAGLMKLLRATGLDPWMLIQALALIVQGRLPAKLQAAKIVAAVDAPPPSAAVKAEVEKLSKRPPPPIPPLVMLAMALCLAVAPACSSPPKDPVNAAQQARDVARMGYSVAAVALSGLADAQLAFAKTPNPTMAQVEVAEKVLAILSEAKAGLEKIRPWLEEGGDAPPLKREILAQVGRALEAGKLLSGAGVAVPKELLIGLEAASVALGGGK